MQKYIADLVRNYVRRLSEPELGWLYNRLNNRIGDDLAESIRMIGKSPDMDRWFSTSRSADELYDMVDTVQQFIIQDQRLRR